MKIDGFKLTVKILIFAIIVFFTVLSILLSIKRIAESEEKLKWQLEVCVQTDPSFQPDKLEATLVKYGFAEDDELVIFQKSEGGYCNVVSLPQSRACVFNNISFRFAGVEKQKITAFTAVYLPQTDQEKSENWIKQTGKITGLDDTEKPLEFSFTVRPSDCFMPEIRVPAVNRE